MELFERLKKLPRWTWWAGGVAVLLAVILALRSRSAPAPAVLPADPPALPEPPAPAPQPVQAEPALGQRDPARMGAWEDMLASALGGLLESNRRLSAELVQQRQLQLQPPVVNVYIPPLSAPAAGAPASGASGPGPAPAPGSSGGSPGPAPMPPGGSPANVPPPAEPQALPVPIRRPRNLQII